MTLWQIEDYSASLWSIVSACIGNIKQLVKVMDDLYENDEVQFNSVAERIQLFEHRGTHKALRLVGRLKGLLVNKEVVAIFRAS